MNMRLWKLGVLTGRKDLRVNGMLRIQGIMEVESIVAGSIKCASSAY